MSSHLETLILMRAWGVKKTGSDSKQENCLGSGRWLIYFFLVQKEQHLKILISPLAEKYK